MLVKLTSLSHWNFSISYCSTHQWLIKLQLEQQFCIEGMYSPLGLRYDYDEVPYASWAMAINGIRKY